MRIWLITVGEPLPCDEGSVRLLRTGILADWMSHHGHDVVWWSSTFDHTRRVHRFNAGTDLALSPHLQLRLLHGGKYGRSISLARLVNHAQLARQFRRLAPRGDPPPDLILCSYPTIELSAAATEFGRARGIPVVLDIRDLWPDIFLDLLPRWAAAPARLVMSPLFRASRKALREAAAITAITPDFLQWGLHHANRTATGLDRDFPMAYLEQPPRAEELAAAERRWEQRLSPLPPESFLCCFFGTIGRQFDLATVIDAARRFQKEGRNIAFVICGDGEHLQRHRLLAQGNTHVLFPGWVEHADIWTLMRRSRAGLAPYVPSKDFQGSISNKSIEYLSAGLPIVTTITGVVGRLISDYDCGLVYGHGDAEQLCAHLTELQAAPQRRQTMSENATRLYRERFRAEQVYAAMAGHLESVVAARQG